MIVHPADQSTVTWALEHRYPFAYVREYGLPEPSLQVRLGVSIAWFHAGRLVHWRGDTDGDCLDQLMLELASLLCFCTTLSGDLPECVRAWKHGGMFRRRQQGQLN